MVKPHVRFWKWIPTLPELVRELIKTLMMMLILSQLFPVVLKAGQYAVGGSKKVNWRDAVPFHSWSAVLPHSPETWLASVLIAAAIFAVLRAEAVIKKNTQSSQAAHLSAIGVPTVTQEPPRSEPADVPNNSPGEDDEEEDEEGIPEGYVARFGMLWRPRYIPKRLVGFEALKALGLWPEVLRVEGPFCPHDCEPLQYKDTKGYRHISEDDDVNWEGSPYCPKCGFNERPDPNYKAARQLKEYRKIVLDAFS